VSKSNIGTCAVFFASGAAALLFETLWFRQAGLALGNTVWATALVTAAFMAGLALGNAFAIRVGWRLTRPLRVFAGLEVVVAVTGTALVFALPRVGAVLAPVLSPLRGTATLDTLRLASTFVLLVLPAAAMGATLPVLARSLGAVDANFGRLLGRLYGWNTLGAVAGALAGEAFLVRALGLSGTALVAATLDTVAASGAILLDRTRAALPPTERAVGSPPARATRILTAAFLAGLLLLALEVVWFRLLLLFVWATTETFAVMLAVVLLGIGSGGLLAAAALGRRPALARNAALIALMAGLATVVSFSLLDRVVVPADGLYLGLWGTAAASLWLMLPVSTASGALFAFLGHQLRSDAAEDARAAGLLTLFNTVGAMLGSLIAGFVLLPLVGMEKSFFLVACAYGGVAGLLSTFSPRPARGPLLALGSLLVGALVLFPFGVLRDRLIHRIDTQWWRTERMRVVVAKEGLSETVLLLRQDALGQPLTWRLLTNGMGMSTTDYRSRRYMGLFAWLPLALHPNPRTALVISYGLGNTARSLAASPELTRIDVVDVSADVLALSSAIWPGPGDNPLRDPRVRAHLEDGRFFLLTGADKYDIITGEPPPPKSAGIVSLYSREHFRLMRERLAEGGIASYWLPVLHLRPPEAFGVVRAFCDVFEDCSLWSGFGHEWILLGSRNAPGAVSGARFARLWTDPAMAPQLQAAGLASPALLGATFLADAATLAAHASSAPPIVDDFPQRLDPRRPGPHPSTEYAQLMDSAQARERFRASAYIRGLWPAEWMEKTLPAFAAQGLVNRLAFIEEKILPARTLADQEAAIATGLEVLTLWWLGSSVEEQEVAARSAAAGSLEPELFEILGLQALARHRYDEAASLLARAEPQAADAARLRRWRILSAALDGDRTRAIELFAEAGPLIRGGRSAEDAGDWSWLAGRFRLPWPE
jgi:spermidine synthase